MSTAVTYLIHYSDQYGHAQHVLGYWDSSISEHASWEHYRVYLLAGGAFGLNETMVNRGVDLDIVQTWPGGRDRRAALRRRHNNRRLCPRCLYGRVRQLMLWGRFYVRA